MKKRFAGPFLALFCSHFLVAQTVDSVQLPTVEVRSSRLDRFAKGLIINELDSATVEKSQNLAEALAADGTFSVRDYGPGSLATISARGLGPSRTPVIWAGLALTSPMNGVADASLLPTFSGDRILVQKGGSSSLFGAGAMGGTVRIEPFSNLKKGFSSQFGQRVGSFGSRETSGGAAFRNEKTASASRFVFQKAANDFTFFNSTRIGSPLDTQVNAGFKKLDFQQHNSLTINELTRFSLDAWLTVADRQIPPPMAQDSSTDWQRDTALRVSAVVASQIRPHFLLRNQAGWAFEAINFFTPAFGQKNSAATTKTLQTEAILDRKTGRTTRLGAVVFRQKARVDDYASGLADQTRAALFVAQVLDNQRVTFSWSLREELRRAAEKGSSRARLLPLTGAVGAEKGFSKNWKSRASISKNYNVPTFNDLFWATGGDLNLLAESGWSGEIGFDFLKKRGDEKAFSASATAFSTAVENWIQWSPAAAGGGFFFPSNLRKVWSRGLETGLKIEQKRHGWTSVFAANGQFNPTTTTEIGNSILENWLRKQVVYVPKWTFSGLFELKKGDWHFSLGEHFIGKRFDAPDGSRFLQPVFLTDAGLAFSKKRGRARLRFSLDGRNLFAENYQSIRARAMPGRNFQGAARLFF